MTDVILASRSPRRFDLMRQMNVAFEAVPSELEEHFEESLNHIESAKKLALAKAHLVSEEYPDRLVIGADEIVSIDEEKLGKPKDHADATRMLKLLSGRNCTVTTAIALVHKEHGVEIADYETAQVVFKQLNNETIKAYLATNEPFDKAGAFGIQGEAAKLIDRIEGNLDTIIGLPTVLLASHLNSLGVQADAAPQKEF